MKPRRDWAYPPLIACAAMCFIDRPWPWLLPFMFIAGVRGVQWWLTPPPLPRRAHVRLPDVVYVPDEWVTEVAEWRRERGLS